MTIFWTLSHYHGAKRKLVILEFTFLVLPFTCLLSYPSALIFLLNSTHIFNTSVNEIAQLRPHIRIPDLIVTTSKNTVFSYVKLCILVDIYRHFRRIFCLHLKLIIYHNNGGEIFLLNVYTYLPDYTSSIYEYIYIYIDYQLDAPIIIYSYSYSHSSCVPTGHQELS